MTDQAWEEYLAAAQRLHAIRRKAADAVAEQTATVQAARDELAAVRNRLSRQQGRIRAAAAPAEPGLVPTPAEVGAAAAAVGDHPAGVLDTLRRTRVMVDEADAAVTAAQSPRGGLAGLPTPARNLLVYGPLALLVMMTQLVLYLVVSETTLPFYVPLCGLVMPAAAFLLGFVTIGLVFPAPPGRRVDRTPVLGAAVCLASVVLLCAGLGILAVLR